jgi:hypothetical protein
VALGLYDTLLQPAFLLNDRDRSPVDADATPVRARSPASEDAAALLIWLTSPENTQLTGQVLFADGGFGEPTAGRGSASGFASRS